VKLLKLKKKICLNKAYSKFRIGIMLGTLLVKNSLKQDVLSSLLFIFALERTVSTVQANQERLKVN